MIFRRQRFDSSKMYKWGDVPISSVSDNIDPGKLAAEVSQKYMTYSSKTTCPDRVLPSTLHTSHCTLHSSHSKLQTSHSTLHTSHSTLLTSHCFLHTPNLTLHTSHCALRTPNLNFTLHTSHFEATSTHEATSTQPLQCDLQRLSCKTQ